MPGPYTSFTRSNSDVPGSGQGEHYFAAHASGLCRLLVWRPSATFTDAPCLVVYKGGGYIGYGDALSSPDAIHTDIGEIAEDLNALGWAVVSVDLPPSPDTSNPILEGTPFAYFPEQEKLAGSAVSYLKANASGVNDITRGPRGIALWGSGNSISPNRIVTIGYDSGASTVLTLAAMPGASVPHLAGDLAGTIDELVPKFDHRPAAAIAFSPVADLTQFDVNFAGSGPFSNDLHPHFMRSNSRLLWSTLDRRVKIAASPYFWILAGYPENLSMPVYCNWPKISGGVGANLVAADFQPGVVLNDTGGSKAFRNPLHHYAGEAVRAAVDAKMSPLSVVRWSDAAENPTYPALESAALQADVVAWLTTTLAI